MDATILSIGTELTTGQYIDTNAAWLSAQLTRLGVRILRHITVSDDIDPIRDALSQALDTSELVIVTGGLGPTPDDLTRHALARAIGQPLEENPEALAQIQALFARWQRPLGHSNRVQALIPRGCEAVHNERGTAPGIHYRRDAVHLVALPGVPGEMKAMFSARVVPMVSTIMGPACSHHSQLRCHGISEAKVGTVLSDLMARGRNPQVGTAASKGIISVWVLARSHNEKEARRLVAADLAEIENRLGAAVFGRGEDTLESVVGGLLRQEGLTVATAESCTGGLLAKRWTDVPGSSAYFLRGYVTYSNQSKIELLGVPSQMLAAEGAVSDPVARAMATGCRTAAGADYALSITGIAGPGGGDTAEKPVGLVYIALADSDSVEVQRLMFGDHLSRSEIRNRACSAALNRLRLRLLSS